MKAFIKLVSLLFLLSTLSYASEQLEYKIYRAGEDGFSLASILVMGKKDAVLIDTHFTKKDAKKVVEQILKSKKEFAISFSPSFDEKNEKEKIANQRALNIQKYLIEEKSIDKKQVVLEKDIKKSSSNIDLNIKEIKK